MQQFCCLGSKADIADEFAGYGIKQDCWLLGKRKGGPVSLLADVIASKSANALVALGDLSILAKAATILTDDGATLLVYEALKKFYGGTWVGGTATLTKTQLSFKPSVLNRVLPIKSASVTVPLNKIGKVEMEGGFITKIFRVEAPELVLRLRCYGAADFVQKIREAAQQA